MYIIIRIYSIHMYPQSLCVVGRSVARKECNQHTHKQFVELSFHLATEKFDPLTTHHTTRSCSIVFHKPHKHILIKSIHHSTIHRRKVCKYIGVPTLHEPNKR